MDNGKGMWASLVAVFVKIGPALLSLLAKLAKLSKVVKVGLAAASFATYAYMFSWKFAAVLMVMIGFHECGHVWAMRRLGMRTPGFFFVPFFGGAAIADEAFGSRWREFVVALMGPMWGLALSGVAFAIWAVTHSSLWAAIAAFWALINFFNLLPINPLDGGRIVKSISFSIGSLFGIVVMYTMYIGGIIVASRMGYGLLVFIGIVGGVELAIETGKLWFYRRNDAKYRQSIEGILEEMEKNARSQFELGVDTTLTLQENKKFKDKWMAEVEDDERRHEPVPTMNWRQTTFAIFSTLAVAIALFAIMQIAGRSEGAHLAIDMLRK